MSKRVVYRPVLNADQVLYLLDVLKNTKSNNPIHIELIKKLTVYAAKIDIKALKPAYIKKKSAPKNYEFDEIVEFPENKREKAFKKWSNNPDHCTSDEIDRANEYRYLNGLMSPREAHQYETEQGLVD